MCVSLGVDRKIRSKVKQSGAGKNSTCPQRTAEYKRRYSEEAETEGHSSQSGWQGLQQCRSSNKTPSASDPPRVMPVY